MLRFVAVPPLQVIFYLTTFCIAFYESYLSTWLRNARGYTELCTSIHQGVIYSWVMVTGFGVLALKFVNVCLYTSAKEEMSWGPGGQGFKSFGVPLVTKFTYKKWSGWLGCFFGNSALNNYRKTKIFFKKHKILFLYVFYTMYALTKRNDQARRRVLNCLCISLERVITMMGKCTNAWSGNWFLAPVSDTKQVVIT